MLDTRNLRPLGAMIRLALPLAAACSGRVSATSPADAANTPEAAPFIAQSCADHGKRTDRALAIDPTNEDVVYLGVESVGFYTTRDGGKTWARIVDGIRGYPVVGTTNLCYAEFYQTVVDARDPAHVCFTLNGDPGTIANPNSTYEGVYCSNDRGAHWSQRVTPNRWNRVEARRTAETA